MSPSGRYRCAWRPGICDGQGEGDDCECQWETVDTLNQTFNLLELVNGVTASLGQTNLAAGTYHQMRLLLHDGQDDSDNILGNAHPLYIEKIVFVVLLPAVFFCLWWPGGLAIASPPGRR